MKLLAIDTAANLCATCMFDAAAGKTLASRSLDIGRGHVEHLMPMIDDVMREAGISFERLDRIAVSVGPGSFTGVRVGVAAARGFSLAVKIPAIGISTLDALAAETAIGHPSRAIVVAIDGRQGEAYTARYDEAGGRVAEPAIRSINDIEADCKHNAAIMAGNAFGEGADGGCTIVATGATASVETYARLGAAAVPPFTPPRPLYLRPPDARPQEGFAVARTGA